MTSVPHDRGDGRGQCTGNLRRAMSDAGAGRLLIGLTIMEYAVAVGVIYAFGIPP